MPIHDKTGERNWSNEVENWEVEFDEGDVVLSDGYASFKTMVVVSEITLSAPHDSVTRRGVFWKRGEAERYADALHEHTKEEKND